ncbi:hypothetical protein WJX72_002652 [[Myrmecia] bisecta]|uniref:SEC7 domain-containing protein n=1 Tax=[Myrmecia] bisecta TaxID=41462 RepID=A0AAW1R608_9CHLO
MRQNSKWALVRAYRDDDVGDDPLLEDFKRLRHKVFRWQDFSTVDPLEYLQPFLEVIRSRETSGPITGIALTSVGRMLDQYIIGEVVSGLAEVMHTTAEAVTGCKFEATDPSADEVVLYKILQVLLACIRCPGAQLMSDSNVINVFQACYRIGHFNTDRTKDMSEMLTQASRAAMVEMVMLIFGNLDAVADVPLTPSTARSLATLAHSPHLQVSPHAGLGAFAAPPAAGIDSLEDADVSSPAAEAPAKAAGDAPSSTGPVVISVDGSAGGDTLAKPATGNGAPGKLARLRLKPRPNLSSEYGLETIMEILGFIISLINSAENEVAHGGDKHVFGLELMNIVLNAGTTAFARHETLMTALREELCPALFRAARTGLAGLSGVAQVALSLYVHLGRHLLLQLEAIVDLLLLRLAEGKGTQHIEQQEAALEGLLDFCNQPAFIRDIYLNMDCRIERSNLFESICALLSKTAFPVNCPLGSVHLLSLDGLFSVLQSLAMGCSGSSLWEEAGGRDDTNNYMEIWKALCDGRLPPACQLDGTVDPAARTSVVASGGEEAESCKLALCRTALLEKHLKSRLAVAADHFNRDYKKGFQFLQTIGLLHDDMDPRAVARFLRSCPGLSKQTIGELLGENDDFFLQVLDAFTHTFNFQGLAFDAAIRVYLESFRLPGEAQKINRIMESFGALYHQQCPDLFKNADAVYILAYSVIMLNTDQHNNQVKKKMTCDEFIRNNRGINGGDNLPQDFLRTLYASISRNEIRISSESNAFDVSPVIWTELHQTSRSERGRMLELAATSAPALDREMFSLMWGPTVAAVSVVLDHADDKGIVQQALDGLKLAAKIAAHHQVDEVMDSLLVSLTKFTALLNPAASKPAVAFGENEKARMATETVFELANRYGNSLRSGWRNILDFVVRLHKLSLLPHSVLLMEAEDSEAARQRLPRASSSQRRVASASSLLHRAFSSLISIDGADSSGADQLPPRELDAMQRTVACVEACRIDEIFADSKFLRAESLEELVKAVMWASGRITRIASTGEDSETAEVCLELLVAIALRNRDRILLLWPLIHEYLAAIMAPEAALSASPLVSRACLGLLRLAQRLLPYKEEAAPPLLASLHLILHLHPNTAWDLATRVATEVLSLVKVSAPFIKSVRGWRTICKLITMTSLHPEAAGTAFEALVLVTRDASLLTPLSFMPCLETAVTFLERHSQDPDALRSTQALDVIENMFGWLMQYGEHHGVQQPDAQVAHRDGAVADSATLSSPVDQEPSVSEMWMAVLRALARASTEQSEQLRNHAIVILHRSVMASQQLDLWASLWVQTIGELLVPLLGELASLVQAGARSHPDCDKTLRMGVNMVNKAILQYLQVLVPEPDFPDVWVRVLQVLQACTKNHSEELSEAVPEALKNMLLVMADRGVLTPAWKDMDQRSLWDLTWLKARSISSGLSPDLLTTAAHLTPPSPRHAAAGGHASSPRTAAQALPAGASPHAAVFRPSPLAAQQPRAPVGAEVVCGSSDSARCKGALAPR